MRYPANYRITTLGGASRYDKRDVILLFTRTELADGINNRFEQCRRGQTAVGPHRVDHAGLAKLLPIGARCLAGAVRVQHQRVTRSKLHFRHVAVRVVEQSTPRDSSDPPWEP